ncbi:DUF3344 domain-containing protein [Heliobacterium gestii]|uniref:DUF3344 domain-containing protein n=1 Tax=Heliomicrobium gestii TaxID=2699 RepID=A0A845LG97_HELGE|nr:DUF3344 domain-containing protein [Heliomicrobium gestii]MBM7867342.1 hypothetical protein [Heliomicrobium gestii]MZP43609.1 DUF3344 domain-containing protein [Heliomicrobium gestii]
MYYGGREVAGEKSPIQIQAVLGPQVPLTEFYNHTLRGNYVAAGVGMRNRGFGTINITLPAGSTILKAFLYWAVIRGTGDPPVPDTGTLNGTAITADVRYTSGDPLWPDGSGFIDAFRADVTGIAVAGANVLTDFPSGLGDATPPQDASTAFPLMEGASLVVIFQNPTFPRTTVVINDGAQTFVADTVSTTLQNFEVYGPPVQAQTTYVVADGQARFADDKALFNGTIVAGPGSSLKPQDAFNGADGTSLPGFAQDGLWDTLTVDVTSLVNIGDTSVEAAIRGISGGGDALTYIAQVFAVTAPPARGFKPSDLAAE